MCAFFPPHLPHMCCARRHLAELVIGCDSKYTRFDMEYGEVVVIETASSRVATPHVMAAHSVPHSMSSDLRAVLPPWPHSAPGDSPPGGKTGDRSDGGALAHA